MLEKDVKDHLVKIFDLKRSGITEIRDQEVIRDGYSDEDLKAITLEKMIEYVGSEETFPRAWELTCAKVKYELHPPIFIKSVPPDEEKVDEATPVPQPPVDNEHVAPGAEQFDEETIKANKKSNDTKKNK